MGKVNNLVSYGTLTVLLLSINVLFGQGSAYDPQLQIVSNVDGLVKYKTTNTPSNTAHFYLLGDGCFSLPKRTIHQYKADDDGFQCKTYCNKAYDPSPPTLRVIETDTTNTGTVTNSKVNFSSSIVVGSSWAFVNKMENYLVVTFENKSSSTTSGCVEVFIDSTQLSLNATDILIYNTWVTNQNVSAINVSSYNKKIKWDYSDLLAGEQRHIYVPVETIVPTRSLVKIGSRYSTSCSASGGSGSVGSNSFYVMNNPHDPNIKDVFPECLDPNLQSPQTLTYKIFFQNEGNGFAQDVVIKDSLHTFLAVNTFELLNSEYNCTTSIVDRELTITFENIFLPGLEQGSPNTYTYDQTESWVVFSICTYPVNQNSPCVTNEASIYFDTQPPVTTNLTQVCVAEFCPEASACLPRSTPKKDNQGISLIKVYPNPVFDELVIEMTPSSTTKNIQIVDLKGDVVFSLNSNNISNLTRIDVSPLASGLYIIHIETNNDFHTHKFYKN